MTGLGTRGSLGKSFRAACLIETPASANIMNQSLLGQMSGSLTGLILSSAAASLDTQHSSEHSEKRRKRQEQSDAFFMEMLRLGELDSFVAETVIAGMDDATVGQVIAQIEATTEKSFQDYAADILGHNMPTRRSGETEIAYQRRVLTDVADAILNDDLTIRNGFENDPLARIIRADALYLEARATVQPKTAAIEEVASLDQNIDSSAAATADNSDAFASLAPKP